MVGGLSLGLVSSVPLAFVVLVGWWWGIPPKLPVGEDNVEELTFWYFLSIVVVFGCSGVRGGDVMFASMI